MKFNQYSLTVILVVLTATIVTFFYACDPLLPQGEKPSLIFPSDSLVVDLNELNHPLLIFIANSELGLKKIEMFVEYENGEREKYDKTLTDFYNPHSFSFNSMPVYTEDMKRFIINIMDVRNQQIEQELPIKVIPLFGLPEVHFEDVDGNLLEEIEYIEGDESPDVFAVINSEEPIKYMIFYQVKGVIAEMINDTVFFYQGEKEAKVNLKTEGDGYSFERGLTALKAMVVVGERNKNRETVLDVTFKAAIKVHLDQDEAYFNGLAKDGTVAFSGNLEVATSAESLTYTLLSRDGAVLESDRDVTINTDNTFTGNFTAHPTLGSVIFTAVSADGKTDELTVGVHVGYRLLHVVASLSGNANLNINTSPGCFFSAEKERIFDYCDGRDNSQYVDVGFCTWSSDREIRIVNVDTPSKFRITASSGGMCSPNDGDGGAIRDWPTVHSNMASIFSIPYTNFHEVTVSDIESETIASAQSNGVILANNFAEGGTDQNIAIYQTKIGGETKRVIVAYDKNEIYDSKTKIYSTFWFYAKVQL